MPANAKAAKVARIFAIQARAARKAVIFRRGPSKKVLLITWHLGSDKLQYGQWFKGRIYERRCDLSPSGDYLIYFAAKYGRPLATWTAICKPPFLTALALWPKGDGWGGGGIFDSELSIQLNHRPGQDSLAPGGRLKKHMRVRLFGSHPGRGEDFPIYHTLLLRNGWILTDEGESGDYRPKADVAWLFKKPVTYEKALNGRRRLQMQIRGVSQKNDAWYWIDYTVVDESGRQLLYLPRTDWADWDDSDLLFAKDGKLFRLSKKNFDRYVAGEEGALKLVANLNTLTFEEKAAPAEAARW